MLELIFQGFLEWTYGLTLEAWEYFSSVLLDLMSLDFQYLRTHMPIIDTVMQIMLAVGWALLIGNLVFQAVKGMMTGLGFEAEDPKLLFTRTFVFAFLLLASPQICQIGLDMTSTVITFLEMPDAVDITFADEASFGGLSAAWLLVILCGIIVMFQTFKLIMEMAERYFILAILTITAPLAFGMGGSRNTSDIFTGWCRMFGSMCLLMALNVVFMKMLLSVLSFYPSGLDVLPWMVLVVTIVKVAKKADGILSRIGLNPAMTGDGLGHGVPGALAYTVVRSMASNVAKTIGKGGSGHGAASGSGKPNSPRTGGPSVKHAGTAANTSHTNSQNTASQQTSVRAGAPQENSTQQTAQQSAAIQQDAVQHSNAQNGASLSSSAQTVQVSANHHTSRKTSVPGGTRRAPSHVTPQSREPANAPQYGSTSQNTQQAGSSTSSQNHQTTNIPSAVAAAVAAGTVVRGVKNLPGRANAGTKPITGGGKVSPAAPAVQASGAASSVSAQTTRQPSVQQGGHIQSQTYAQSPNTVPSAAQQEPRTSVQTDSVVHSAGIPAQAGIVTTPAAQKEPTAPRSGIAGTAPAAEASPSRSGGAPSGTAGNPRSSIGGRFTQQEAQAARTSEQTHSTSGTQTMRSGIQQAQSEGPKQEPRSTNRERPLGSVPAGMAQVGIASAVQHTGSQATVQTQPHSGSAQNLRPDAPSQHPSNTKSEPRSTQRQTQASVGTVTATSSPQTSVQTEQRSSQRPSSTVQQNVGHTSAAIQNTAVSQNQSIQTEQRTTQRSSVSAPQDVPHPMHSSHGVSSAPSQPAASEARSTQRPVAPAAQETAAVRTPVNNPSAVPAQPAQAEPRSTQRTPTQSVQPSSAQPSASPLQPQHTAHDRIANTASAQSDTRATQRQTPAPAAGTHPTTASVQSTPAQEQPARQSRNTTPTVPSAVVVNGKPSAPAQQESRTSAAQAAPAQQAKRPAPAPQEARHPASGKRDTPMAAPSGTAGIGRVPVSASSAEAVNGASVQQEQGQFPQKTFVPLSGKQPESIPSHLDLRQEPQKTTKRPAETEVGHVTE